MKYDSILLEIASTHILVVEGVNPNLLVVERPMLHVCGKTSSEACRILVSGSLNVQSLCYVTVVIVVPTTNIPDQNPPNPMINQTRELQVSISSKS